MCCEQPLLSMENPFSLGRGSKSPSFSPWKPFSLLLPTHHLLSWISKVAQGRREPWQVSDSLCEAILPQYGKLIIMKKKLYILKKWEIKRWKFLVKASACTKSITACMNCSTMGTAANASNDISVFQITECKGLGREAEEEEEEAEGSEGFKGCEKQKTFL